MLCLLVFCQTGLSPWVDCLAPPPVWHINFGVSRKVPNQGYNKQTSQHFFHPITFALSVKQESCKFVFESLRFDLTKELRPGLPTVKRHFNYYNTAKCDTRPSSPWETIKPDHVLAFTKVLVRDAGKKATTLTSL